MIATLTTREYRISNSESVYLTKFGQAGVAAYCEVASGKQTADALESRLRAHTPPTDDDALGLRCALLGVEHARTRDEAGLRRALAALEAETVNPPAPVYTAPKADDCCRHGVSFVATCAQCAAEDA